MNNDAKETNPKYFPLQVENKPHDAVQIELDMVANNYIITCQWSSCWNCYVMFPWGRNGNGVFVGLFLLWQLPLTLSAGAGSHYHCRWTGAYPAQFIMSQRIEHQLTGSHLVPVSGGGGGNKSILPCPASTEFAVKRSELWYHESTDKRRIVLYCHHVFAMISFKHVAV
jgi:hypothetical protein